MLTYTITVADAAGLTTTRDVVINVTGSNDAPVLTVGSGSYTDTAVDNTFNTISGTFTTADKDAGETLTYSLAGSTAGTVIIDAVSYDLSHPTSFGTLHVNSATGAYAYVPNDAAIEGLKTDALNTFSITVTDSQGGSDTKTFQVSFTGANDAAVITGDFTGSVTEAVSNAILVTPTATGNLNHTDRDEADVDDAWTAATLAGSYGTLTITAAGGWEYTLNNNHASVQALNASGTLVDHVTVATADGTTKVIDITINGANDAAEISGTVTGIVAEAGGTNNATNLSPTATGDRRPRCGGRR